MLVDNDIVEIKFMMYQGDQLGLNILHYRGLVTAGNAPTEVDLGALLNQQAAPLYANCMVDTAAYIGCSVQAIWPNLQAPFLIKQSPPTQGATAGDALPRQTSGIITKKTNQAGRKGRGRVYVPFPGEADSGVDARPSLAYMTALNVLAAKILQPWDVVHGIGTFQLRPLVQGLPPSQNPALPVVSWVARRRWATQRRRGDFGRPNSNPFE